MKHKSLAALTTAGLVAGLLQVSAIPAAAAPAPEGVYRGDLSTGSRYVVDVPADWNGKLLLNSLGYIGGPPGGEATSGPGGAARTWLLEQGYAMASMKPTTNGWAVEDFLEEQPEVYEKAVEILGQEPVATIAWGSSMGGLISAALAERHPEIIDGALPMCASVAGGVGMLNSGLDGAFVFKTLLAPENDTIELVNLTNESASTAAARSVLDAAQATPEGRARVAFAAAVANIPGWSQSGQPRPADDDYVAQQAQQASQVMFSIFSPRTPLEARAGGNFSWNTGVDYSEQLTKSGMRHQVEALYEMAGLDLDADLAALAAAPRITADASAVQYMLRNATPTGNISQPVLTLLESGDTAPVVTQAEAYADAVAAAGRSDLLRQAFVDRPGHCGYSAAETLAALDALVERIDSGSWPDTSAAALDARAQAIQDGAPALNLGVADFADLDVNDFARPYYPRETVSTTGTLPDGTRYSALIPANWNGKAGVFAGATGFTSASYQWLAEQGVAMVGYQLSGDWDLARDRDNATASYDVLSTLAGAYPSATFQSGQSQGGLTTRIVAQAAPDWLDGALPMCGGGAGAISMWNYKLDSAFVLKTLVDPSSPMTITRIQNASAENAAATALVDTARETPLGQARLVFAAAMSKIPVLDAQADEIEGLENRIDAYGQSMAFALGIGVRAGFEATVGGGFSWNNDVDYREQLLASGRIDEVRAAYARAGADLEADLNTLQAAPRITADKDVVEHVERLATFDGDLSIPVVTLHTIGDTAGTTADDDAYRRTVERAGASDMLRETTVKANGHCAFSHAERVAAFDLLLDRIDSDEFDPAEPADLNARAAALASQTALDLGTSRFMSPADLTPAREWDVRNWGTYSPESPVPAGPTVTTEGAEVLLGDAATVTLESFTTGGAYELWLAPNGPKIADVTVDVNGSAQVDATIPDSLEPGRHTLEVRSPAGTLVADTELTALPTAAVAPATGCVGKSVQLRVAVTNTANVRADIIVDTPFGSQSFTNVKPGKTHKVQINTKSGSIPAGSVGVTTTVRGDDGLSSTTETAYAGFTCG